MQSNLIGVDRRGGKEYREVPCEVCGNSLFISSNNESGICAICVVRGYSEPRGNVNLQDLRKAFEKKALKEYRRKGQLSQAQIARALEISERHYWNLEKGQPISRSINLKVDRKLAQIEQGQ